MVVCDNCNRVMKRALGYNPLKTQDRNGIKRRFLRCKYCKEEFDILYYNDKVDSLIKAIEEVKRKGDWEHNFHSCNYELNAYKIEIDSLQPKLKQQFEGDTNA